MSLWLLKYIFRYDVLNINHFPPKKKLRDFREVMNIRAHSAERAGGFASNVTHGYIVNYINVLITYIGASVFK